MEIRKSKSFGIILLIAMLALLTSGCSTLFESKESTKVTEITLTPVELFKGDGAKFRPFMGAMSGAFKLRYTGRKPHATLHIDTWQNGKKVATVGSIGELFFSSEARDSKELEVIISIDKVSLEGKQAFNTIKVGTQHKSGSNIATFTVPWDNKLNAIGLINYSEPLTFHTDETVHLWGMQATSTNEIRTSDFSPEALSRLEWAIIFTLTFDENERS